MFLVIFIHVYFVTQHATLQAANLFIESGLMVANIESKRPCADTSMSLGNVHIGEPDRQLKFVSYDDNAWFGHEWQMFLCRSTGRVYFRSVVSGDVRWECPVVDVDIEDRCRGECVESPSGSASASMISPMPANDDSNGSDDAGIFQCPKPISVRRTSRFAVLSADRNAVPQPLMQRTDSSDFCPIALSASNEDTSFAAATPAPADEDGDVDLSAVADSSESIPNT